jgi:hypothetical protein
LANSLFNGLHPAPIILDDTARIKRGRMSVNGRQEMARSGKGTPRKPATKLPNLRKKLQKITNQTRQAKKK